MVERLGDETRGDDDGRPEAGRKAYASWMDPQRRRVGRRRARREDDKVLDCMAESQRAGLDGRLIFGVPRLGCRFVHRPAARGRETEGLDPIR